jgi:hypothetical protein
MSASSGPDLSQEPLVVGQVLRHLLVQLGDHVMAEQAIVRLEAIHGAFDRGFNLSKISGKQDIALATEAVG